MTHELDDITAKFEEEFRHLTPTQMNWKANDLTWSIAQNIHHLIVINSTYFPIIQQWNDGTYQQPWYGKIPFIVSKMGKMILRSASADRSKKIKTFPIWEPAQSVISENILDLFIQHQRELKKIMLDSEELIRQGAIICSPASKWIVYSLKDAFDIIITHEKRHLEQAKEVKKLIFPSPK